MAPSDPRFASRLANDPRFIRPSKASTKVTLDDRFKDLLQSGGDDSSANAARVDKYGRKVGKNKSANDLKAFYRLDDKGKGKQQQQVVDRARGEGLVESSSEEEDESSEEEQDSDEEDEEDEDEAGDLLLGSKKARRAAAKKQRHQERAAAAAEDDDSEGLIDLDEDDGPLASTSGYPVSEDVQFEASIPTMEGSTKRIAIVNLDWDNVRSIDIYKVFDSVLSPSASGLVEGASLGSRKSKTKIGKGRVVSVKIYPSQFGKERMEREEKEGPPVEIFSKNRKPITTTKKTGRRRKAQLAEEDYTDSEDSDEEDEGNEYDEVALRRYQLERLRYYYAVVEFDTVQAAQHAYEEIEGTEFEATANVLDLRYVPDDTTFEHTPTDTATANSVEVQAYKPVEFVTDALRNSKVKLTWDADDPARAKLLKGTHDALTSQKLKKSGSSSAGRKSEAAVDYSALLASDSEDDAEAARRMRSAFGFSAERASDDEDSAEEGAAMMNAFNSRENGEDGDMEITFGPALSGALNEDDDKGDKDETSLDAYQRKERERRLLRKEKRKAEKKRLANKEGKGRTLLDKEDGGSDPDEAFDANQFEAAGNDEDGNDIFFAGSDRASDDDDEEGGGIATEKKLSKKAARQLEREAKAKEAASLSLLVNDGENGSDAEEGGGDGRHFDMQAILRAEKISSKPKKILKKGKDRRKHTEAKELLEREKDKFEVDTKDDRFKRLHEDHEFALDPSNPRYMKTKNMERLLEESRKRRSDKLPVEAVTPSSSAAAGAAKGSPSDSNGLSSLVESIKRKSSSSSAPNRNGSLSERKIGEKKAKKQKRA